MSLGLKSALLWFSRSSDVDDVLDLTPLCVKQESWLMASPGMSGKRMRCSGFGTCKRFHVFTLRPSAAVFLFRETLRMARGHVGTCWSPPRTRSNSAGGDPGMVEGYPAAQRRGSNNTLLLIFGLIQQLRWFSTRPGIPQLLMSGTKSPWQDVKWCWERELPSSVGSIIWSQEGDLWG